MAETPARYEIRLAEEADVPRLRALIELSVRVLERGDYSEAQIESALGTALGVDTRLIRDRTYFVAEASLPSGGTEIVACGGWSKRRTLFGSDHGPQREDSFLDPGSEPAKIRAFFVHPDWIRMGIATRILRTCEDAALADGFGRLEMGATLTGVPLYLARGYTFIERLEVPLPNGLTLPVVRMGKTFQAGPPDR